MLKTCVYCGGIHQKGFICPKKPKIKYTNTKPRTQITKFRSSIHWQRVRQTVLVRDRYLCRACLSRGVYTSGDLEVHHIIPLSEDFSLRCNPCNLVTLCPDCHELADRGDIAPNVLRDMIGNDDSPPLF